MEHFELPLIVRQREEVLEQGMTQDEAVRVAIWGAGHGMREYPQLQVGLILCSMVTVHSVLRFRLASEQ